MIELRHLRYFIAVAEHLNFSRAAESLGTAQPSLSQQIRQLEDDLGVELFARGKRQIALTPAGDEFLRESRALLAQLDTAVTYAREAERGLRGELRIAYTPAAMLSRLPAAIRAYRIGRPDVRIKLAAMAPPALLDALRRREIDAGVLLQKRDSNRLDGVDTRCIGTLPFGVALPESHRLAGRRSIKLEELGTETLIVYGRQLSDIYDEVADMCRSRSYTPARVEEADRIEAILGLVAAGEGISIGPRVYDTLRFPGVTFTAITPAPKPFSLVLVRNAEVHSALAAAFVMTCERTQTSGAA